MAVCPTRNDAGETGDAIMHELVDISLDVEILNRVTGPRSDKVPLRMTLKQWEQSHWRGCLGLVMLTFAVAIGVTILVGWLIDKRDGSK